MRTAGIQTGRLIQRRLNSPRMSEWENDFMALLEHVQSTTDLIEKETDVRNVYGIGRMMRRGATVHVRNMEVSEDLIKAVNRWTKDDKGAARLDMIELYSASDALTPTYMFFKV
jgi:hypothetical protein